MVGLFEPVCAPWKVDGIPDDFSFGEIPPDWDRMGPYLEKAMARVPIIDGGRRAQVLLRPRELHARPARRSSARRRSCKNYFVAAGLNSIGILTGGGIGRVLAHWIVDGRPDVDVTGINIDRLHAYQANPEYRRDAHGRVARHGLPVPLPDALDADRARREAVAVPRPARAHAARTSATSAAGRAPTGTRRAGDDAGRRSRCPGAGRAGSPYWAAEHRAAREGVIVMDMSFMSQVPRRRAATPGALLNRISANDVDGDAGHDHVHAVAQRGAASSRPTSRSPSSTTSGSGSSPPTPRTATSRPGCGATSTATRTRSSPT